MGISTRELFANDRFFLKKMSQKESFAERMMRKQGWHDGGGLGKNNQGIAKPIKASLKFDHAGIGHDMAKEFTNNWWDLAYAKASSGIQIEENQDGDTVEIKSKKKNRKRKNKEQKEAKKKLYSGFVKSAT